jgi:phage baseplate assembly protein W
MTSLHIDHPFHFDAHGRTATCDDASYVRRLVELALFTASGERVNRPDFGSGVRSLVFAPNGPELAATLKVTIRSNLQRWLSPVLDVVDVDAVAVDETLRIEVAYRTRGSPETRVELVTRPLA